MRKICSGPILLFSILLSLAIILSFLTTRYTIDSIPLGDFRGITLVFSFLLFLYGFSILFYRLFINFMPIKEGNVHEGSRDEFVQNVYVLFFLILFRPIIGTKLIPVPLNRIIYLLLGARLGPNTYCAGIILDPPLTAIGSDTIIGHEAVLYSHAIEGDHLSNKPIRIGNNVTIGAKAILMSGVEIGDNTIVAAGAIVPKDTRIKSNEIWGGAPARFLKQRT